MREDKLAVAVGFTAKAQCSNSSAVDTDAFEVAFGIARIYDDQLEDGATAVTYYEEALTILEAISTEATAWGAYMRVTTLGALAVCYENLYDTFGNVCCMV